MDKDSDSKSDDEKKKPRAAGPVEIVRAYKNTVTLRSIHLVLRTLKFNLTSASCKLVHLRSS